jgi:hypothetical protein
MNCIINCRARSPTTMDAVRKFALIPASLSACRDRGTALREASAAVSERASATTGAAVVCSSAKCAAPVASEVIVTMGRFRLHDTPNGTNKWTERSRLHPSFDPAARSRSSTTTLAIHCARQSVKRAINPLDFGAMEVSSRKFLYYLITGCVSMLGRWSRYRLIDRCVTVGVRGSCWT